MKASLRSRWLFPLLLLASQVLSAAGLEGRPAPPLRLNDPAGIERSLQGLAAGRPTVVLFWASWCPYCKALMPHLQSLLEEFGSERVEVVAVNLWEENPEDWRPDYLAAGYDFRVLLRGEEAAKDWKVSATPGLFLVGAGGEVLFDRNARTFAPQRRDPALLAGTLGNPQQAARVAPLWAAELRKAIRAALQDRP